MFKVSKKHTGTMSNIFNVSNNDTRTTSGTSIVSFKHILHFVLLLILLDANKKCWLSLRNISSPMGWENLLS